MMAYLATRTIGTGGKGMAPGARIRVLAARAEVFGFATEWLSGDVKHAARTCALASAWLLADSVSRRKRILAAAERSFRAARHEVRRVALGTENRVT